MSAPKAQRLVWGETLAALAASDPTLLVLDADLATSTRSDLVADAHPDAFVEVGIAEQNMVGMAAGLATVGYRPWVSSFGVFLTHRAIDQIRMSVSQTKLPVRIGASYAGLLNGSSGKTHQDVEDLAILRAMPNMTVLAPADEVEAAAVIRWACEHPGPVYVRLARDAVAPVFAEGTPFTLGVPVELRAGDAVSVVSTGVQTSRTAEALDLLAADGIRLQHLHLATLKPVDVPALRAAIAHDVVVTVEEHSVIGGLGGLVAEEIAASGDIRLHRIGLADRWSESAPNDWLLDRYGLSPARVAGSIMGVMRDEGVAAGQSISL